MLIAVPRDVPVSLGEVQIFARAALELRWLAAAMVQIVRGSARVRTMDAIVLRSAL